MSELTGKTVLVIGRGSGIARAVALRARAEGARVIVAGRDRVRLAADYAGDPGVTAETVDVTDDDSIAGLAGRVGRVDHLVSTASARARGELGELIPDPVARGRARADPGQRDLARRDRHRHLGRRVPSETGPGRTRPAGSGPPRTSRRRYCSPWPTPS